MQAKKKSGTTVPLKMSPSVMCKEMNQRSMRHDMSPEIASKSLSALQDRKQEIISELKEIVGTYAFTTSVPDPHSFAAWIRIQLDKIELLAAKMKITIAICNCKINYV